LAGSDEITTYSLSKNPLLIYVDGPTASFSFPSIEAAEVSIGFEHKELWPYGPIRS